MKLWKTFLTEVILPLSEWLELNPSLKTFSAVEKKEEKENFQIAKFVVFLAVFLQIFTVRWSDNSMISITFEVLRILSCLPFEQVVFFCIENFLNTEIFRLDVIASSSCLSMLLERKRRREVRLELDSYWLHTNFKLKYA